MKLFFWQNIVSHLQLPYIREIAKQYRDCEIFLTVPEILGTERKKLGWNEEKRSDLNNLNIIVEKDLSNVSSYFSSEEMQYHFFSGIRSTSLVQAAFLESLQFNVQRHLIVEGPLYYNYPRSLHLIKTLLFEKRYFKYINKIYAIGHHATEWYQFWGFRDHQVIPFSYCVDVICKVEDQVQRFDEPLKCIYIGSLKHRKGVDLLLNEFSKLNTESIELTVVGDGDQKENLLKFTEENNLNNVTFTGTLNHNEIGLVLAKHDCLVLPSRHDGWGAVMNEALMCGLNVICSENCGAKVLIQEGKNGFVFSHRKNNDLVRVLKNAISMRIQIRNRKEIVKEWSNVIHSSRLSRYFMENLTGQAKPKPPWRKPCR